MSVGGRQGWGIAAVAKAHFEGKVEYQTGWRNYFVFVKELMMVALELLRTRIAG